MERVGLRLKLRRAQAEAGDIVLLYGDESEALTHPYLAHAWAPRGADLRVAAPGQSRKVAIMGALDATARDLNLMFDPDLRDFYCEQAPNAFTQIPNGWGRMGATRCDLRVVDEPTLEAALHAAYALAQPRPKRTSRSAVQTSKATT